MTLKLLPTLSLGTRLDEIERTARELFGDAVTISAETETPYTRSDEKQRPDKSIKVVIAIELPGAFPKLSSLEGARAVRQSSDPAGETTHTTPCERAPSVSPMPRSRLMNETPRQGASGDFRGLGAAPGVNEDFTGAVPASLQGSSALERCVREIEEAYTRREPGLAIKAVPSWPLASIIVKHFPYDPNALPTERWRPITAEEIRSLYREHMPYEDAAQRIADALNAKRGESASSLTGIGHGDPAEGALHRGPVIPMRVRLARVLYDAVSEYGYESNGWDKYIEEVYLVEADAALALIGTQRAPVKLPRFDERSGRWSLVTEKGSGTYADPVDAMRQALADAGVEYEGPSAPLGRPEDQA